MYNSLQDCWEKRPSAPQPTVRVFVSHYPSDTRALGITSALRRPTPSPTTYAVADTGCQSCLAGTNLLRHLGLAKHHLTPVKLQMTAANEAPINILGALALRISDTHGPGGMETRQVVYFTDSTQKFFLSRGACEALGVIGADFPKTGPREPESDSVSNATSCNSTTSESCMTAACDCPRRQLPPPPPQAPPYPPTDENAQKIEDWLLKYYSSSTFNVCSHQPLPAMEGPPLRLMVDPAAQPVASPQTNACANTLAEGRKGRSRSRLQVRRHRRSTSQHTCHLVPPHGHQPEEEWQASPNSRPSGLERPRDTRNPPYPIPIPTSSRCSTGNKEDRIRRLERIPRCSAPPGRSSPHDVHHPLGPVPIPSGPPGLRGVRRWLHEEIRRHCGRHTSEDEVRR